VKKYKQFYPDKKIYLLFMTTTTGYSLDDGKEVFLPDAS